jgi:outer membrane lipoprotein SlyB
MNTNKLQSSPGAVPPSPGVSRAAWIAAGAVALTIGGIASALAWRNAERSEAPPVAATAPVEEVIEDKPAPAKPAQPTRARAAEQRAPVQQAAAPVCANCGVVESVQAVKQQGEGSGVGAVAGGVAGGVLGNQFGKGGGRAAMTVLGAVGGGFAGNEIEKNVKAKTVYSVKLRMDDGTLRTVQQSQAPAVGARVRLEGSSLHAV